MIKTKQQLWWVIPSGTLVASFVLLSAETALTAAPDEDERHRNEDAHLLVGRRLFEKEQFGGD
jgi:hypothetical protein